MVSGVNSGRGLKNFLKKRQNTPTVAPHCASFYKHEPGVSPCNLGAKGSCWGLNPLYSRLPGAFSRKQKKKKPRRRGRLRHVLPVFTGAPLFRAALACFSTLSVVVDCVGGGPETFSPAVGEGLGPNFSRPTLCALLVRVFVIKGKPPWGAEPTPSFRGTGCL